jgi:hypothetical protein
MAGFCPSFRILGNEDNVALACAHMLKNKLMARVQDFFSIVYAESFPTKILSCLNIRHTCYLLEQVEVDDLAHHDPVSLRTNDPVSLRTSNMDDNTLPESS